METCCNLDLIFLVATVLTVCLCQDDQYCPVVSVGSSFSCSCDGQVNASDTTFVIWQWTNMSTGKGTEFPLSVNEDSGSSNVNQFLIQNRRQDGKLNSSITISNVSLNHSNHRLTCLVQSEAHTKTLHKCVMAVYRKASEPETCSSTLQTDGGIFLSCTAKNVFPGISCQYMEMINSIVSRSGTLSTKRRAPQGEGLFESNCSELVYPLKEGNYSYTFHIKADYESETSYQPGITVEPMVIQPKPWVKVSQTPQAVSFCQRKEDQVLRTTINCLVRWLKEKPYNISVFFKGQPIQNLVMKQVTKEHDNDLFIHYEANGVIETRPEDYKGLLLCEVMLLKDGPNLSDTKRLEVSRPPTNPPSFKNNNVPLGSTLIIKKGESVTVECEAKSWHPAVPSTQFVSIHCMLGGANVSTNGSSAGSASITVFGNATHNQSQCICVARLALNCSINTTSYFNVSVVSRGRPIKPIGDGGVDNMFIVYMLAGVVCIIITIFCIIIIIHWRGCQIYESFYSIYGRFIHSRRNEEADYQNDGVMPPSRDKPPERPAPRITPRRSNFTTATQTTVSLSPNQDSGHWEDDPHLTVINESGNERVTFLQRPKTPKPDKNVPGASKVDPDYVPMFSPKKYKHMMTHDDISRKVKVDVTVASLEEDYLIPKKLKLSEAVKTAPVTEKDTLIIQENHEGKNTGEGYREFASLGFCPSSRRAHDYLAKKDRASSSSYDETDLYNNLGHIRPTVSNDYV